MLQLRSAHFFRDDYLVSKGFEILLIEVLDKFTSCH